MDCLRQGKHVLIEAFNRTYKQLLHPAFRKVFFIGALAATATLVVLLAGLIYIWPESYITGWAWLDRMLADAGDWLITLTFIPVAIMAIYFLFPPVAIMVMGTFLDQVVAAVEGEYYPSHIAQRQSKFSETFLSALRLGSMMLLLNILAFIPYILLFFMTGGLGSLALYLVINGYLIGREYFELVASGHHQMRDAQQLRRLNRGQVMWAGIAITGLFMVPFLNILAPIIGASVMTHIYHDLRRAGAG